MSTKPAKVTQSTLAKTIRAIEQAKSRLSIEIATDGTIRLVPPPADHPAQGLARPKDVVL
jgi:hypothetical protein